MTMKLDYFGINKSLLNSQTNFSKINKIYEKIKAKTATGINLSGWIEPRNNCDEQIIKKIINFQQNLPADVKYFVVCGIGGSYLGARAFFEAIDKHNCEFNLKNNFPKLIWFGQNLSAIYIEKVVNLLKNNSFACNIISKSGTTLETCVGARILLNLLLAKKYSNEELQKRIVVTCGDDDTPLRQFAIKNNLSVFDVPKVFAGRYSVFSPVGLIPLAVAGLNIRSIMDGIKEGYKEYFCDANPQTNLALNYAIYCYELGKKYYVHNLVSYHPSLVMLTEWWKQLFGESHGKQKKGTWPAACTFTTDLHSMGQFIQDGSKIHFQTVVNIERKDSLKVPKLPMQWNLDNLAFLSNIEIEKLQQIAVKSVTKAHSEAGEIPCAVISIPPLTEKELAKTMYFFFISCAFCGWLMEINPFDNDAVNIYKENMRKHFK